MSYRITEAERKHVAAIEDTKAYLDKVVVEGQTDKYIIHIEDGDLLNIKAELPSYKFAVDKIDDKNSRIRLVDSVSGTEILCTGYNDGKENLGIGWRYNITFTQDDDGYVNAIKLYRENDGKVIKVLTFDKISTFTIKNLTVDASFTSNGLATFNKDTIVNGSNFEVNEIEDEDGNKIGGKISSKSLASSIGNITALTSETLTATDTSNLKNINAADGIASISNETIDIKGSSITSDEDTSIVLSNANITNLVSNLSKIELAEISDAKIVNETVTKSSINGLTVEDNLIVNSPSVFNSNIKSNAHINAKTLDANAAVITNEKSTNIETSNLSVTSSENVAKSTIGDLGVTNDIIIGNDAIINANIEVKNNLTVANESKLNIISADELTSKRISSTRNETTDSIVNNNETISKDLTIGGTTYVDTIKSNDNKAIITSNNVSETIGSEDKVLTLVTGAENGTKDTDDYYGHIKAIVNGKETFLATTDDIDGLFPLGVVDKYSNQTITGIKTFDNMIVANAGVTNIDDDGNVTNIISHVANYNEAKTQTNPKYNEAATAKEEYDAQVDLYNKVYSAYSSATKAQSDVDEKTLIKDNAEAENENAQNSLTIAQTEYDNAVASVNEQEKLVAELKEKLDASYSTLEEANNAKNSKSAEIDAETAKIESAKSAATYPISNEDIVSYINTIKSNETIKNNSTLKINSITDDDLSETYTFDNASIEIDKLKTYITAAINTTSDTATISAGNNAISALTLLNSENQITYNSSIDETTLSSLKEEYTNLSTKASDAQSAYDADLKAYNEATATLEDYKANDLIEAETALDSAKTDVDKASKALEEAEQNLEDAESAAEKAQEEFFEAYKNYSGETISEMPNAFTLSAPEKSELVSAYEAGNIPETILDYEKHTIFLGDSEDELQIKTKALADGNEHIQATIGGKSHLLANLDDIVTGIGEDDSIVTDVSTSLQDKTITISKTTNTLIKSNDSEEKNEPVVETIGSLAVSNDFNIAKDEDTGVVSLSLSDSILDTLDRSNKTIEDISIETNKTTIIYNDATSKEYDIEGDVDVTVENNIIKTTVPRFNNETIDKEEVVNKYNNLELSTDSLNKLTTAADVKLLHDDSNEQINALAHKLQTRLPVAPNAVGNYTLYANVVAQDKAAESSGNTEIRDDISVTYGWSANQAILPNVALKKTEDGVEDPDAGVDSDGNYLDPNYEYGLKLRFVDTTDDDGNIIKTPQIVWTKLSQK